MTGGAVLFGLVSCTVTAFLGACNDQSVSACKDLDGDSSFLQYSLNAEDPTTPTEARSSKVESACACSSKCVKRVDYTVNGHCGDAVGGSCTWERLDGFAVLQENEVYRLADLLRRNGFRYRLDSRTILCEPHFRKTLLRQALMQSTSLGGEPLADLCFPFNGSSNASEEQVHKCEERIAAVEEPQAGFSHFVDNMDTQALKVNETKMFQSFLSELSARRHDCQPAGLDEIIVPIRLGDKMPLTAEQVVHAAAAASSETENGEGAAPMRRKKVIFSGVMHYGHNQFNGSYMRSGADDASNLLFLNDIRWLADAAGIPFAFRSQPIADEDLCFLVFSLHVYIPPTDDNFLNLIIELRRRVGMHRS